MDRSIGHRNEIETLKELKGRIVAVTHVTLARKWTGIEGRHQDGDESCALGSINSFLKEITLDANGIYILVLIKDHYCRCIWNISLQGST
jgi:hypothetical protein